jgi:hypothetical protein
MTAAVHPALALIGRWRLTRRIEDFRAGGDAHFEGEALLAPDLGPGEGAAEPPSPGAAAAHLLWAEHGILRIGGAETQARRSYLWRLGPPDIVDVSYEDRRFFHAFVMAPGGGADVRHDCPPDLYDGAYLFEGPDLWRLTWRVRGPRKDYRMTTEHLRIG